jgi:hypothetical protein
MNDLLKATQGDTPVEIRAKVQKWCASNNHDDIEDAGFLLALSIGEDARRYNPRRAGSVAAEAFDIGVSLALMPWHYDAPDDEPTTRSYDRSPPQVPSTLKAKELSLHSPFIATVLAACVGVLGWIVMVTPH